MTAAFQERYQAGSSLIHRLDARVKVVVALLLIVGIVLTPIGAWPAYPLLWALVGSLAAVGKIGVWRLARLAGLALPFTLTAATLLFTTPGHPLINIAGLVITDAGLARFLSIVLKSWLAFQVGLLLSMTTHFTDLLWALDKLHVPAILVAIIGFMYRYLFTLREESVRLLRARTARSATAPGYQAGGGLLWRARVTGGMVGNLFLRSYERSERVYAAMLSRGYNGQMKRAADEPLTWNAIGQGVVPLAVMILIEFAAHLWWGA